MCECVPFSLLVPKHNIKYCQENTRNQKNVLNEISSEYCIIYCIVSIDFDIESNITRSMVGSHWLAYSFCCVCCCCCLRLCLFDLPMSAYLSVPTFFSDYSQKTHSHANIRVRKKNQNLTRKHE